MTITTNIRYPLARSTAGRVVRIKEAIRGHPYECFGCSAPMVARQGTERQWHFAHKPPFERCTDPDKALHDAAVAMVYQGFYDALGQQNEYHLGCPCAECGRAVSRNIAITGASVVTEKSIVAGTRSDLVVHQAAKAPVIIEVVVTHDLEPEAHKAYTQSGVPVLKIRPTWNTVTELQSKVIADDTLNVTPIQCAACREAEENRRREEERIRERVVLMLRRMDLRRQPDSPNPPFVPWTHDKFGEPMSPQIRQQVYINAIILTELGFAQDKDKRWLFRFPLHNGGIVFANFGSTVKVPIQKDTAALINWSTPGYPSKLEYTVVEGVLARCRKAGADVQVDFHPWAFDRVGNHLARNSIRPHVDKTVLYRLLAQAERSFPEAERYWTRVREARTKGRGPTDEDWAELNEWINRARRISTDRGDGASDLELMPPDS